MSFVVAEIFGFTCLDNRLYVVYYLHAAIHVYTADTFSEVSVITVDELMAAWDIIACPDDHQLYVIGGLRSIWRVSAVNPTDYELWLRVRDESRLGTYTLSLTSRRLLVLVTSPWYGSLHLSLHQYNTVNKELLRVIDLSNSVKSPTHAVETSRDTFVVSHDEPHSGVSQLFSFIHLFIGFTSTIRCVIVVMWRNISPH